jgi:hypothetical protein
MSNDRFGLMACACAYLCTFAAPALAHHGRDFLLTQTAHLPQTGEVYFIARQDYLDEDEKEIEFEPAIIGAVADRLTLEAHSHIERPEGQAAIYESTGIAAHVRFTRRDSPFALGSSVEYEAVRHSDADDTWEFATIASYEARPWMASVNFVARVETGGATTAWDYAGGVRRSIADHISVGLEAAGTFETGNRCEAMLGLFMDPIPSFTVNIGVGTGINNGPDFTFRSAFVFHLAARGQRSGHGGANAAMRRSGFLRNPARVARPEDHAHMIRDVSQ